MNAMRYNGCTASIKYSTEDECLVGHIAGIRDIVGFHGNSVVELRSAFEEAVDDYLALDRIDGELTRRLVPPNLDSD